MLMNTPLFRMRAEKNKTGCCMGKAGIITKEADE